MAGSALTPSRAPAAKISWANGMACGCSTARTLTAPGGRSVASAALPAARYGHSHASEYRQHRSTSSHFSIDAAKAHRDDVVASWEARSMRDYAGGRG